MATLRDVVAYICASYPYKAELSKARLTKLVYLADWKMSIDSGKQITPTHWYFNHYGPYVEDIENLARLDDAFDIERTANYYGQQKEIIYLKADVHPVLSPDETLALDFAINNTKSLSWNGFIKLIYSTYPILTRSRHEYLDLPSLAGEYKKSYAMTA